MKSLIALLLFVCSISWAQAPRTNVQFGDDTWVNVPLQFPFPLYGATFTNSFMFSNGVVGFFGINQNPMTSFCCSGENLSSNSWTGFNYSIMPLWTDLYPVQSSSFYTEGDSTYQKYQWNNIAEISNMSNLNTFGVTIHPSGLIKYDYDNINIQNQFVTSAVTGNLANNEFTQFYHGIGMNNSSIASHIDITPQYNDPCINNSLYSPSCPGYQQAYHDQQCSANPLYAVTCPGYQAAYYTQQCSIDPLYDSGCPGYQSAYFNQQCSLNALYDTSCPGYQAAYFNQQCTLNTLYNEACLGYTAAYYDLQCSINTLYDSGCSGYAQAYFNQQCTISGLYNRSCSNYAQAYATQQLLNQQNNSSSSTQTVVAQTKTSEPSVQVSSKGEVSTEVQLVADPTVNEVLKDTTKKEVKSSSPTSEVSTPVATRTQTAPVSQPAQKAEQKQEQKKTDNEIAKIEKKSDSKDSKDTKSNREKVKEAATEKAKELANEMSNAATLEAQTASQGLVLGLMNYNPGFSAYANAIIPDSGGVEMARQYNKPTVDNRRALRALSGASDRLHQEMVDGQYR